MEARVSPVRTVYESCAAAFAAPPSALSSALAPRCLPVPAVPLPGVAESTAPVSTRLQEPRACRELSDSSLFARPADESPAPWDALGVEVEGEAELSDLLDLPLECEEEPEEAEGEPDASEEAESPDESLDALPDELDKPVESELSEEPDESDDPPPMPVSTSADPESLLSPDVSPQVWKAPTPSASRSFSATAIC